MDQLPPFPGFRDEAFQFLRDLAVNNRRDWFKPRKTTYVDELVWPMQCLLADATRRASSIGLPLRSDPRRSIFRIYRDVRFSSNKDPYKTAVGAVLSRNGTHRDHGVVYVHVQPGQSFLGAGFWQPESRFLRQWRDRMAASPGRFLEMAGNLEASGLSLNEPDDRLKRMPRGFEALSDEPIAPFLRFKSFTVSRAVPDADMGEPPFTDSLMDFARSVLPLLSWGWEVADEAGSA